MAYATIAKVSRLVNYRVFDGKDIPPFVGIYETRRPVGMYLQVNICPYYSGKYSK